MVNNMNIRCFYRLATPALVGVTLLFLAACSQDPQPAGEGVLPGEGETMVLSAEIAGPETRTALSDRTAEGDYKVLWKEGDRISVNGTVSDAVSSTDDGKKEVSFTLSGSFAAPYKVLYPGTTSLYQIVLPAAQSYVAGNFDPAAAASYGNAWKDGDTFHAKLNNFCGVLRFALHGSATLDRMEIKALGGEKLYGSFTLATNGSGFTGAFSGGTAGKLTYNIDGVELSSGDTYFYIPIPAQMYSAGIEALVYQADGAFMRLKFWGDGRDLANDEVVEFASKAFVAGRTENLFTIEDLNAEAGGEPSPSLRGVTVATYNIMRFNSDERTAKMKINNPDVQQATVNALKFTYADVIGINEIDSYSTEGGPYCLKNLAEAGGMTGYSWELNFPNHITYDDTWPISYIVDWFDDWDPDFNTDFSYACGFAYKSSVLTLLDCGRVWLRCKDGNGYTVPDYHQNTHNAYGYCGKPTRTCVWAKFTHIPTQKQFYFFVTHLPTTSQVADTDPEGDGYTNDNFSCMDACVLSLNRFVTDISEGLPCILVGDMNRSETQGDGCYASLLSYWNDAFNTVRDAGDLAPFYWNYATNKARYVGTMTGSTWDNGNNLIGNIKYPRFRYDQIHTRNGSSQSITARSYKSIRSANYEYEGETVYPSDHLPVVSYITFD